MEGKNFWRKFIPGGKKESSTALAAEATVEDVEGDLRLLKDRLDDPDETSEESAMNALSRLLKVAESNLQIRGELEKYSKEHEEHLGDEEEEPEFIKNSGIYRRIHEWFKQQRLGKFYYDKNNPGRKLGT